jgi:predicted ester cyclase
VIRAAVGGEPVATPDQEETMSQAERVLRAYSETFEQADVDGLAAMYAARTDYRQPYSPEPLTSPAEVKAFETGMFAAFSDISLEVEWLVTNGDEGAAGVRIRATHTNAMPAPDGGEIPATNRTIELHTAEHIRLDGAGKIVEHRRYMDSGDFFRQLGLA